MSTNRLPTLAEPAPRHASFIGMSQPDPEDRAPVMTTAPAAAAALTPADELIAAARDIRAWQNGRVWTDARMLAEFAGLGSDKTYKKLHNGDTSELNVTKQLANYRAVLGEIDLLEESQATEPVYADIGQVGTILTSLGRFIVQRGLRRFFLIEGPSGSGKTNILNILCQRQPAKVLRLNGRQRWRSLHAFLLDLLDMLPAIDRTDDAAKRKGRRAPALHELMRTASSRLLSSSRVLAIDEAQYLTGAALNFLKDCINEGVDTGTRFYVVVAGQDTLWKKLESSAEEEAKQLRHNRLFRRVVLVSPEPEDCRDFLERSLKLDTGAAASKAAMDKALADLSKAAKALGHWAFVRDVRDDLRTIHGSAAVTHQDLASMVKDTAAALGGR